MLHDWKDEIVVAYMKAEHYLTMEVKGYVVNLTKLESYGTQLNYYLININQAKVQKCQNKTSKIIFRHYDWSTILFYCFECYTFYNIPVANGSSASPAPSKCFVLVLTSALLYLVISCMYAVGGCSKMSCQSNIHFIEWNSDW